MHDIETSLSLIPGQARFADIASYTQHSMAISVSHDTMRCVSSTVYRYMYICMCTLAVGTEGGCFRSTLLPSLPPSLTHICKGVEGAHYEDDISQQLSHAGPEICEVVLFIRHTGLREGSRNSTL